MDRYIAVGVKAFGMRLNTVQHSLDGGPGGIVDGNVSISKVIGVNSVAGVGRDIGGIVDDDGAVHRKIRSSGVGASQEAADIPLGAALVLVSTRS